MAVHELPESSVPNVSDVTVIMPIAGRATRAREVTKDEIPKHLIRLGNGETVLDTITGNLQRVGFRKFAFCVGFLKEQLKEHINEGSWRTSPNTAYAFDETDRLLGVDGTVIHAIGELGLTGQAMIIPGDLVLPWNSLATMNQQHAETGTDVTLGLTSVITERTTDVGKIVTEEGTGRLLWTFGRTDAMPPNLSGAQNMTSAAATSINTERYVALCEDFRRSAGHTAVELSLRDNVLPWAAASEALYDIQGFDIQGEILDLGTPANIHYGQQNWQNYV